MNDMFTNMSHMEDLCTNMSHINDKFTNDIHMFIICLMTCFHMSIMSYLHACNSYE